MIRGSKNFVRGVPLHVAIGVIMSEKETTVVGGPVDAITHQTDVYMKIVPGEKKSSQIAKQIRQQLSKKVSETLKARIMAIPLEEIQRFIPLGRGKIE